MMKKLIPLVSEKPEAPWKVKYQWYKDTIDYVEYISMPNVLKYT